MNRILQQRAEGCAIETLLVLDATTGQNAVSQAKLFNEVANITGIVLTKLDGTAKGGIVVSIKNELGIPVKLVGVGEKIDDLQKFNNADFVKALFDHSSDVEIEENAEESELEKIEAVAEESESEGIETVIEESEPEEIETVIEESEPEEIETVTEEFEPEEIETVAEESEPQEAELMTEEIQPIMKELEPESEPEENSAPKKKKSLFSRLFSKKED
ncbi:MAG: signal recognition particle-docking protein FtsY, partial [Oscillospiraceae bacterium]|nr:signal recognition particle-docking protein FtsY [Oscillospiraceae bacterium]